MKERIINAIDMLTSNRGEDWFVVLEDAKTEKFIQFTYDEGYGLQLDLPLVALEKDEAPKAEKLLAEYNITAREVEYPEDDECCCEDEECDCGHDHEHSEHCDCGCEGEEESGPFLSFNEKIGDDKAKAVEIAYRVFKEVYGLKDNTDLNVTIFR